MRRWILVGLCVAALGCKKESKHSDSADESADDKGASEADDPKTSLIADVLDAWRGAGIKPDSFGAVKSGPLGGECEAGTVEGLETILCQYDDAKAAKKAEDVGFKVVGETTGTSMASGRVLLVVADRSNADPDGKHLNKLARVFRKLKTAE